MTRRKIAIFVAMLVAGGCAVDDGIVTDTDVEFEEEPERPAVDLEHADDLVSAARRVADLAAESADEVTGTRLEDGALIVAIPDGDDLEAREARILDRLREDGTAADVTVRFEVVEHSRADLDAVRLDLRQRLQSGELGEEIVGIGEDPSRGVIAVYATERSTELRKQIRELYGSAVVFRLGERQVLTSRTLDVAPHWGGAGYAMRNDAGGSTGPLCSTAFPIDINGNHYMLTAGHCLRVAWYYGFKTAWAEAYGGTDTKYRFGTMFMTTWAPWAKDFGDFGLLQGSTYRAKVYETSSTAIAVTAVDWGMPSLNEQVCLSGRTTGKVCRLIITDPDYEGYFANPIPNGEPVYITKIAQYKSDQNLDGVADCKVGGPGDSGGAIFQWTGNTFRAMGVLTGGRVGDPNTCKDDRGSYTRLGGVRLAYPTATMPVY